MGKMLKFTSKFDDFGRTCQEIRGAYLNREHRNGDKPIIISYYLFQTRTPSKNHLAYHYYLYIQKAPPVFRQCQKQGQNGEPERRKSAVVQGAAYGIQVV